MVEDMVYVLYILRYFVVIFLLVPFIDALASVTHSQNLKAYYQAFFLGIDWFDSWAFGLDYQAIWYLDGELKSSLKWFDYQVIWHNHLKISDSAMWKHLQNVYSQIKTTRLNPLSQSIWQPTPLHPVSYQPPTHRRLLPFQN